MMKWFKPHPFVPYEDIEADKFTTPFIDTIPGDEHSPFWSVMIPTYNRPEYLEQLLQTIIDQAPSAEEMQIEVIDNYSTVGDIQTIVQRVGQGRIDYFCQSEFVSANENFNTAVRRSRGHWLHIPHDDDLILDGFYQAYRAFIEEHPECGIVLAPAIFINENNHWNSISHLFPETNGIVKDAHELVLQPNRLIMPTAVVKRNIYEKLGGYSNELLSADWEFWVRVVLDGGIIGQLKRPYYCYRKHNASFSMSTSKAKKSAFQYIQAAEVILIKLPNDRERASRRASYFSVFSTYSQYYAEINSAQGDFRSALYYRFWAFRFQPNFKNAVVILITLIAGILNKIHSLFKKNRKTERKNIR